MNNSKSLGRYLKQHWQLYVFFLGPALLLTIVFKYLPMGGILIAFQKYNPIKGILASRWVGLKHFERFLSSPDFIRYLVNTLKLSLYGLLWGFPVPILLALLLNKRCVKGKTFWRAFPIIAYAVPGFITLLGFKFMFSYGGPINYYIKAFGGNSIGFLDIDAGWKARIIGLLVNAWMPLPEPYQEERRKDE